MPPDSLTRFFQSSGLVSRQTAEAIAEQFSPQTISRQVLFLKEGRVSDEYLLLEKGFMRAFAHDTAGREVTTGFYAGSQVVFEVSSFFNRTPSYENIQALTDCEGWCLSYAELNGLFHTVAEFREFGRHILVKGFATLKDRMLSMITEPAEARYERLLATSPQILQHAPLKYVASYLGITDTSLSRIRKEISRK